MGMEELEFDGFTLLDLPPDLLVEIISHRIAGRLDQGDRTADGDTAGQGIADREGHGKVHGGESKCFGHVIAPVMQVFDAMEQ